MSSKVRLLTADDLWEVPDLGDFEVDRGRPSGGKVARHRLGDFRRTMAEAALLRHLGDQVYPRSLGVVGPGFAYALGGQGLAVLPPDLAFVRADRLPPVDSWDGFAPMAPDLAIEVPPAAEDPDRVAEQVATYLRTGVPLVWVVDAWQRSVATHGADGGSRLLGEDDDLDGGIVVPGFRVRVAELFR